MKTRYLSWFLLLPLIAISSYGQNQDIRRGGGSGGTNSSWGSITGTIADQTDLATALTNKVSKSGDMMPGMLTNNVGYAITNDVFIYRDAANTLALRNGANAQTFNVYNTYTDASNYEKGVFRWSANQLQIGMLPLGTGQSRDVFLFASKDLLLGANSANAYWKITSTGTAGSLLAVTDNTYDIGASGANRPRNVYVGTGVYSKFSQDGYTKVCTSAVSNALFYVSVPNTNMIGGRVLYTVNSTDGTDSQQITGTTQFGAVGKSTTVTANVTDVQNTSTVSAGTLTAVVTANVSTNNVFAFMITPTTSLTTTNLTVKWRLETPSTYTVNPL